MLQAMKDFMRGLRSLAGPWQMWVGLLVVLNMLAPLVFLYRSEAQYTLAATLAGGMIGMLLVKVQGFTRLLGLMHIFWIPLVAYLWVQMPYIPLIDAFGIWVRAVLIVDVISLVIDAVDVARYMAGERKSLLEESS